MPRRTKIGPSSVTNSPAGAFSTSFTGTFADLVAQPNIVAAQQIARIDRLDFQQHLLPVTQDRRAAGDDQGQEGDLRDRQKNRRNDRLFSAHAAAPCGKRRIVHPLLDPDDDEGDQAEHDARRQEQSGRSKHVPTVTT